MNHSNVLQIDTFFILNNGDMLVPIKKIKRKHAIYVVPDPVILYMQLFSVQLQFTITLYISKKQAVFDISLVQWKGYQRILYKYIYFCVQIHHISVIS